MTSTLVAASGPLFVTVKVKVTAAPTLGVKLDAALARLRSACSACA